MVQVTINYTIDATNTGAQHDLICGCSLLDPNSGEELIMLPWWIIYNVGTGGSISGLTISGSGDIPARTYQAKARAWENYSGGTKITDITYEGQVIGALYQAGTGALTGILDEAVQTLVIGGVPGEVSATIDKFTITI